jgi:CRISPR-associated protein Cmr4
MYTLQRFVLMTLDPVHVGTGGYRLGRVDLSIAREPGTNLPKIPGTSLAGAARSYAAMRYEKPQCAGQVRTGRSDRGRAEPRPR